MPSTCPKGLPKAPGSSINEFTAFDYRVGRNILRGLSLVWGGSEKITRLVRLTEMDYGPKPGVWPPYPASLVENL